MNTRKNKRSGWVSKLVSLIQNLGLFTIVYFLLTAIEYLFLILLPEKIFNYEVNYPAVVYVLLSATSIVLTTVGEEISRKVYQILFRNYIHTNEVKALNERRIRFLLIFIYFWAIIVFTLASLNSHPVFEMEKLDYSILQSFATYIAYDRMVRNFPTIFQKKKN